MHTTKPVAEGCKTTYWNPPIWLVIVVLVLLAIYAAPDLIAWTRGEAPVMAGRMK